MNTETLETQKQTEALVADLREASAVIRESIHANLVDAEFAVLAGRLRAHAQRLEEDLR